MLDVNAKVKNAAFCMTFNQLTLRHAMEVCVLVDQILHSNDPNQTSKSVGPPILFCKNLPKNEFKY